MVFDKQIMKSVTQLLNWHEYTTNKADMDKIKKLWKNFILIFTQVGSNRFESYLLKFGKRIHQGKY